MEQVKKKRMRPKRRVLHELPNKEIVKSGTIRLAELEYLVTTKWDVTAKFYL